MRKLMIVGVVALTAACGGGDSTAIEDAVCPSAQVKLCMKADSVLALVIPMTSDAATRSAGALTNPAIKATLATELSATSSAIASGNVTQAANAVERARAAVVAARQSNSHPGDAPDLTAIELALLQLALALK